MKTRRIRRLRPTVYLLAMWLITGACAKEEPSPASALPPAMNRDPASEFVMADGVATVRVQCTRCHSARLVIQNRATRQGWTEIIRWMQRTQKLGDLGNDEAVILDYLATHYGPGPRSSVRRRPLSPDLRPLTDSRSTAPRSR